MTQLTKYRGFDLSYENGLFIGKNKDNSFQNASEAELKQQIDTQLLKVEQKRIKLDEYNGFTLFYEKGMFRAQKGNHHIVSELTEQLVKQAIDKFLAKSKEEQELQEKIAKQKERLKKVTNMKAVVDAAGFKELVYCVSDYVSEARLCFNDGLLTVTEMDPANVALIKQVLKYKGNVKEFQVAVNFDNLKQLIRTLMKFKPEQLTIKFKLEDEHVILVIGNGFGQYDLPSLEMDDKEVKVPELKHTATVKIPYNEFRIYVELADAVAESMLFQVKDGQLGILAKGDLSKYEKPDIAAVTFTEAVDIPKIRTKMSIEFLKKRFLSKCDTLTLHLKTDYPLQIDDEKGNTFVLAPRVEND